MGCCDVGWGYNNKTNCTFLSEKPNKKFVLCLLLVMQTIYFCCLLLQVGYLKFQKKAATQC